MRFKYEEARAPFDFFTSYGRGSLFIYSKAQYEKEGVEGYDKRPAGTGPYQFVERSPGRILYRRVENHWSGITPDFEELELRFIGEASTRLAMLAAGEADIALLPKELNRDAQKRGLKLIQSQQPAMQTNLALNGLYGTTGDPAWRPDLPWANIKIREALSRALNREEMIDVLFDGKADVCPVYAMYRLHEGYDPKLEQRFEAEYGYNPERARQLLREANYPDAFPDPTIPLILTDPAGQPEIPTQMELIKSYYDAVGFKTVIREIDHAAVGALGRARKAYFINPIRNLPIRPTEAAFRAFYTVAGGPYMGWESDWIEGKIKTFTQEADPEKRDKLAREIFNYGFDNYIVVPLFQVYSDVVVNPDTIAGWTFPGNAGSVVSHWELIKAAR